MLVYVVLLSRSGCVTVRLPGDDCLHQLLILVKMMHEDVIVAASAHGDDGLWMWQKMCQTGLTQVSKR